MIDEDYRFGFENT